MAPIQPSSLVSKDVSSSAKKRKIATTSAATSILGTKTLGGPSRDLLMANRDAEDTDDDSDVEEAYDAVQIGGDDDDEVMIDTTTVVVPPTAIIAPTDGDDAPMFEPIKASATPAEKKKVESRIVPIPPHRMSPLQKEWVNIFTPLTEMLGLQVRMNTKKKAVEMRTSKHTKEIGAIQKGADYVKAFALGFLISDAIALLRLDDLYLDSFEIKDVKSLSGDHLSRAIGRIAGQDGKTKFTIENATRTRIILADTKIHIMGSFQNIRLAKDAIVNLILGSPPGKVYASLRTVASRLKQRAI